MGGERVKRIVCLGGIAVSIIGLFCLYIVYASLPFCTSLDPTFLERLNCSTSKVCYTNYACARPHIPRVESECYHSGLLYYPLHGSLVPCPTQYSFPHWLSVIFVLLFLICLTIYLIAIFKTRCWNLLNLSWGDDEVSSTPCERCSSFCVLKPSSAVCGLCAGYGKISDISYRSVKSVDTYSGLSIAIGDMCPSCRGKGWIPTFMLVCRNCSLKQSKDHILGISDDSDGVEIYLTDESDEKMEFGATDLRTDTRCKTDDSRYKTYDPERESSLLIDYL